MSAATPSFRCYSQRMLDPFHGMMSVVETAHADAVSRDGVHWSLFVRRKLLEEGPDLTINAPDVHFGSWSPRGGLRRAPVRSTENYGRISHHGESLLTILEAQVSRLPFEPADRYELWLLEGGSGRPLALVGSALSEEELRQSPPGGWNPGVRAREYFLRRVEGEEQVLTDRLREVVEAAAGGRMAMQWFLRDADGRGHGCGGHRLPPGSGDRVLEAAHFPELPLRPEWEDPEVADWVTRYHRWQAPWLLTLTGIEDATRAWLEEAAAAQALWVEELHRLYPRVLDPGRLKAILVEAGLRRAAGEGRESPPDLDHFTFGATGR